MKPSSQLNMMLLGNVVNNPTDDPFWGTGSGPQSLALKKAVQSQSLFSPGKDYVKPPYTRCYRHPISSLSRKEDSKINDYPINMFLKSPHFKTNIIH